MMIEINDKAWEWIRAEADKRRNNKHRKGTTKSLHLIHEEIGIAGEYAVAALLKHHDITFKATCFDDAHDWSAPDFIVRHRRAFEHWDVKTTGRTKAGFVLVRSTQIKHLPQYDALIFAAARLRNASIEAVDILGWCEGGKYMDEATMYREGDRFPTGGRVRSDCALRYTKTLYEIETLLD